MTWTPTKTSTGTGDWTASGSWTPAGMPGINDYVQINHNITINTDAVLAGLYVNGAALSFNSGYGATVKDAAGTHAGGAHIEVSSSAASSFYRAETGNGMRSYICSQNAVPTYRVKMRIVGIAGYDARTLGLSRFEIDQSAIYLGNGTNELWFNTGNVTTDGLLSMPSKMRREQRFNDHFIPGRNAGRINRVGGHAGTIDLSGILPWAGFQEDTLEDMRDSSTRLAFISQFASMPKCRIENLRPGEPRGMWQPFSLTLVEDI